MYSHCSRCTASGSSRRGQQRKKEYTEATQEVHSMTNVVQRDAAALPAATSSTSRRLLQAAGSWLPAHAPSRRAGRDAALIEVVLHCRNRHLRMGRATTPGFKLQPPQHAECTPCCWPAKCGLQRAAPLYCIVPGASHCTSPSPQHAPPSGGRCLLPAPPRRAFSGTPR